MIDLFLTDPPYNVNYSGGSKNKREKIKNDHMKADEYREFLSAAFQNAFENLKAGAAFYIWCADKTQLQFAEALKCVNLKVRQVLIWNKNSLILGWQDYQQKHEPCLYGWKEGAAHRWYGDRKQTTVLNFKKPNKSKLHPTQKPVELMAYLIGNSTQEGGAVLDLFGGSGSTLIACEELNRKCYMMELDENYCETIIKRWEDHTGKKAVLCE